MKKGNFQQLIVRIDRMLATAKESSETVKILCEKGDMIEANEEAFRLEGITEKVVLMTRALPAYTGFTNWGGYAIYNTRNAAMKWRGQGEMKANIALDQISEKNTGVVEINSAILFCETPEVALETLAEAGKSRRKEYRFDGIYDHIHYVTLDPTGQRILRLLLIPKLKERQLELLFDDAERSFGRGRFEYDAKIDDRYVYAFLDGNIAGLGRFKEGIEFYREHGEVLCYPHDVKFVKNYFGGGVTIKTIDIGLMETELGIGKEKDEI